MCALAMQGTPLETHLLAEFCKRTTLEAYWLPETVFKDALDGGRAQGLYSVLKAARTGRQLSVACNLLNEAVGKAEYDQRCLAQVMQYANVLLGKSFAAALSKL